MIGLNLRLSIENNLKFSSFQRPKIYKYANKKLKEALAEGYSKEEANTIALNSTVDYFKGKLKFIPNTLFIFIVSCVFFLISLINVNSGLFINNSLNFSITLTTTLVFVGIILLISMLCLFPFFRTYDFLFLITCIIILIFVHLIDYSLYSSLRHSGGPNTIVSKSYFPGIVYTRTYGSTHIGESTQNYDIEGKVFSFSYLIFLAPSILGFIAFIIDIIKNKTLAFQKNS